MILKYDVVIIGGGIGGLVCGCYLAKNGFNVAIFERNSNIGGYCNSFRIKGFQFDAFAHSIGSLSESGKLGIILNELDIKSEIRFDRYDPSDIIITPDKQIQFFVDFEKTLNSFKLAFPLEIDNIQRFFKFINTANISTFSKLLRVNFEDVLNEYFKDPKLKSIFSLPILGNVGLSASKVSAFSAITLYKEFILDGGYYPVGGMQKFSDFFAEMFKKFGGKLFLSSSVQRIIYDGKQIKGVETKKDGFVESKYVVSNADVSLTFFELLGEKYLDKEFATLLKTLTPSTSMFALYLGLKDVLPDNFPNKSSIWYLPDYDIETIFQRLENLESEEVVLYLLRYSREYKTILALVNTPFKDESYWSRSRQKFIENFIEKIELLIPNLRSKIEIKTAATPHALFKWTNNSFGSAYGWAATPDQIFLNGLTMISPIKNLYLVGHWTTISQGVPGVAFIGRNVALKILKNKI